MTKSVWHRERKISTPGNSRRRRQWWENGLKLPHRHRDNWFSYRILANCIAGRYLAGYRRHFLYTSPRFPLCVSLPFSRSYSAPLRSASRSSVVTHARNHPPDFSPWHNVFLDPLAPMTDIFYNDNSPRNFAGVKIRDAHYFRYQRSPGWRVPAKRLL